jgi:FtsZ-binding cell division protein ZapB
LRAEILRKEKSIHTLRMNIEELKTDRDLCAEQAKTLSDKLKQTRADLERKDKVV